MSGIVKNGLFCIRQKKKMHVSDFSFEKTRYGWLALSFYFIDIFYMESAFITTFFSIFDNILLTIHSKMLRVGKRETHIYFFFWPEIQRSPANVISFLYGRKIQFHCNY